jgi:hypothetical protein
LYFKFKLYQMSNGKKGSSATSEQKVETAPVVPAPEVIEGQTAPVEGANGQTELPPVEGAPAPPAPPAPEVPEYMKPLLAERAKIDEANVAARAQLDEAFTNAKKAYVAALTADDFKQTEAVVVASAAVKAADEAIIAFDKNVEVAILARDEEDAKMLSKWDICEKFGITLPALEVLIAASKDEKDTLKVSFKNVFGLPSVRLDRPKSATAKDISAGANKTAANGEVAESSDKRAEATADLAAGLTYDELLAKYPTHKKDGTIDVKKLNGTVRTVISEDGWDKQSDGTYKLTGK